MRFDRLLFWKTLFFSLLAAYCCFYAPYGINETDGGFLSGLAWQLLSGKTMYADLVYVRPPIPVWLRALELTLLPEQWAVLGERWIFYGKVALYAWLGAAVLTAGAQRWILAVFGFVVSVHSYPPAAWHTVDGILFGALGIWCWTNWRSTGGTLLSGVFIVACLLCKQSFYPMAVIWGGLILFSPRRHGGLGNIEYRTANVERRSRVERAAGFLAFGLSLGLFCCYLYLNNTFSTFWQLTNGATSGGQALQHGVLDYFRIQPVLAVSSVVLLSPVGRWFWQKRGVKMAFAAWALWLLLLACSFGWTLYQRQEFTVPFAQTRLLFWIAAGWGLYCFRQKDWNFEQSLRFFTLLGLSWCAAVSWGYNLPILFALPWVYAVYDISNRLLKAAFPQRRPAWLPVVALLGLLVLFRLGYEFVYRDGPRGAMTIHLGDIFPKLHGIYSSAETAALYRDLRDLAAQYGPNFKTLPAFPHANFLTGTRPPLPLDWVVAREMQAGTEQVVREVQHQKPVLFIEKEYAERLGTDPELQFTKDCLRQGRVVAETGYFWVVE